MKYLNNQVLDTWVLMTKTNHLFRSRKLFVSATRIFTVTDPTFLARRTLETRYLPTLKLHQVRWSSPVAYNPHREPLSFRKKKGVYDIGKCMAIFDNKAVDEIVM